MAAGVSSRAARVSHAERKRATRAALVLACQARIASGTSATMLEIARAAGVSEATAYRYFPDLVTLVKEALSGLWPLPAVALAPVASSTDPVERVDFACEFLLRTTLRYQGMVRAVISDTLTRPEAGRARPGFRFGLIARALDPVVDAPTEEARRRFAVLKADLSAVMGAEALFSLTDLAGMDAEAAVASLRRTASTVTATGIAEIQAPAGDRSRQRR